MTRIIAGEWGGRRLRTPAGAGTRPTSDRVRESLFQTLGSMLGPLDGFRVLDLFAGSGALALEAESRGAVADLVESDRRACGVVAGNLRELGARSRLHRTTAERFVRDGGGRAYDLVLLDPPYAMPTEDVQRLLEQLVAHGDLAESSVVVVERSSRDPFAWPATLRAVKDKAYGETTLWYGRPVLETAPTDPQEHP